jgi:eukaryotic-like serine/threonine-protein kinase
MLGAGSLVAGYRVERVLGAGGMGAVYLVANPELPRHDALKVLDAGLSRNSDFRARFIREADLASMLDHPNIVSIYRRGQTEDGRLWIAMQFVDGIDADVALQRGQMSPARAIYIVGEVAKALDYAHQHHVIHRDVKPANFLLTGPVGPRERVVLGDFGIARALHDAGPTVTGALVATVAYAAPELFGSGLVDHRADVYSLGCSLFRLLTGEPPFASAGGQAAAMMAHLQAPPPRISDRGLGLPPTLDAVIATAMAKEPAQRYPTAGALAAAAAAALHGTHATAVSLGPVPWPQASSYPGNPGVTAHSWPNPTAPGVLGSPPQSAPPQARRSRRRGRPAVLIAVVAAVIAVAATATIATLTRRSGQHPPTTTTAPAPPAATTSRPPSSPLPASALPSLLPSVAQLAGIMGDSNLEAKKPFDTLIDSSAEVVEKDCVGALVPVQLVVYDKTGWMAVHVQSYNDPDHAGVFQGVVAFPIAAAAHKSVADQTAPWSGCSGRTVTRTFADGQTERWVFGPLANTDGTLSMTQVQEGGNGWGCQRALAARNNIVIDVLACHDDVSNQAVDIVNIVAAKVAG